MGRLIKAARRWARDLAGRLVTWYLARMLDGAVRDADRQHGEDGKAWFVVDHPFEEGRLTVMDRKGFKKLRRFARDHRMGHWAYTREFSMKALAETCYYHTANGSGGGAMSERDRRKMRVVFIRMGLMKAGLYDKDAKNMDNG